MKKLLPLAALGLMLAMLTGLPAAAAQSDQRTIVVVATGSVNVLGEPADWTVGAREQADSPRQAMGVAARTLARVRKALVAAGVADLRTANPALFLEPQDESDSSTFVAKMTVSFTAASPQRAAVLIDKARAAGATYVSGPDLSDSAGSELSKRALEAAVDSARVKGQALAAKMGGTLGPVLAIESAPYGYDGFDPEEGELYATVAVEFAVS